MRCCSIRIPALLACLVTLVLTPRFGAAQYQLKISVAPYQDLVGATRLPMRWDDDQNPYVLFEPPASNVPLFNTNFRIDAEQPIAVSKWGNIELLQDSLGAIFDGFFSSATDSTSPEAQVLAKVTVDGTDTVIQFEWHHIGFRGYPASLYTNTQIWLYTRTGTVEIHFGPNTIDCANGSDTTRVSYCGGFLGSADFSKVYTLFWLYGDPAKPRVSKASFLTLKCVAAEGTVYRFEQQASGVRESDRTSNASLPAEAVSDVLRTSPDARVTIYNVLGIPVLKARAVDGEVDMSRLKPDVYFAFEKDADSVRLRKIMRQ